MWHFDRSLELYLSVYEGHDNPPQKRYVVYNMFFFATNEENFIFFKDSYIIKL